MSFDHRADAGTLTLDPDEVETSPTAQTLDHLSGRRPPVRQSAYTQPADASPMPPVRLVGTWRLAAAGRHACPSLGQTISGVNRTKHRKSTYNYGQSAIPRLEKGVQEVTTPGQRVKGATESLERERGMGASILPLARCLAP